MMRSLSLRRTSCTLLWSLALLLFVQALEIEIPPFLENRIEAVFGGNIWLPSVQALEIPPFLESQIEAVFGGNSWPLKERRAARREAERRAKFFILDAPLVGEVALHKRYVGYGAFVLVAALFQFGPLIIAYRYSDKRRIRKTTRGNRPGRKDTIDVVVVGCGLPKRGMGWYHLIQLLDMPSVNVRAVVEPFYLSNRPKIFDNLVQSLANKGVVCVPSLAELHTLTSRAHKFKRRTLCFIAGRTSNNPTFFRQCVEMGCSAIYLEKPGAMTSEELSDMRDLAASKQVSVFIGFNRNVSRYILDAVKLSRQIQNCHVFLSHCNSYDDASLPEVFSRCSEGLMKSMGIHELAILVTHFNVSVENIEKFQVNPRLTKLVTLKKLDTATITLTDFRCAAFKIKTKEDVSVSVLVDRSGGYLSFATVKDGAGNEVQKFEYPTPLAAKTLEKKMRADPQMMPYFFVQSEDFLELKRRVISCVLDERDVAEGVATIDVGVEALRLAEYATKELTRAVMTKE